MGFLFILLLSPLVLLSKALSKYYIFFILYYFAYMLQTIFAQFVKGIEKTVPYTISGIIGTAVSLSLNIVLLAVFRIGVSGYFYRHNFRLYGLSNLLVLFMSSRWLF